MIKRTRIKIMLVTMAILGMVFVIIGAVAYTVMTNKPQKYRFEEPGAIQRPPDSDFDSAIKEVETQLANEWLLWYSLVAGAGLAGLTIVTYFLSGWIVSPIRVTMEKQRQFVSDVSHELKTPISIISANADVLAGDAENKWLQNIKAQTERMKLLINDLIDLAKLDEASDTQAVRINLSEVIGSTVLAFESVIYETGKTLITHITDNAFCTGVKEEIVKAAGILIDNAVKYSCKGEEIKVSLYKYGDKNFLEVYNTGSSVSDSEKTKIFDRFYRSDYSRTRENGGSGLGLAILKSLADKNGWKISVNSDGTTYVSFTIQF